MGRSLQNSQCSWESASVTSLRRIANSRGRLSDWRRCAADERGRDWSFGERKKKTLDHMQVLSASTISSSAETLSPLPKLTRRGKKRRGGGAPQRTLQKGKEKKHPRSRSREIAKFSVSEIPSCKPRFCRRPRIQPASYSAVSVKVSPVTGNDGPSCATLSISR